MKITKEILETLTLFDRCCFEKNFKEFISSFYRERGESEDYVSSEVNVLWEYYKKHGLIALFQLIESSDCEDDKQMIIDLINLL